MSSALQIIIRASGERTEGRCAKLARKQGKVHIIKAYPFGESLRQTYALGMTFEQEWTPVIDADVLLFDGVLKKAIDELNALKLKEKVVCLDGKTKDKILMVNRRAGIHIYRTELFEKCLKYIDDGNLKPESNVRKRMHRIGYHTHVGNIIFGEHDHEQYYKDLWRKAVCQAHKVGDMIKKNNCVKKWKAMIKADPDYKVILAAHDYGKTLKSVKIDARKDYGGSDGIKKLGLKEKKYMGDF